jgi:hypothetical protein
MHEEEMGDDYVPIESGFCMYFIMKEIMKCGCYDKEPTGDVIYSELSTLLYYWSGSK